MRYIKKYYDTSFLLIIIWCVLNEDFSIKSIVIGFGASLLTILLVDLIFSDNDDVKNYRIQPILFIQYIIVLIYQIMKSGIQVSRSVFNNDTGPKVVHIRTTVHNHWYQCIIANSITLTPGTVTIDKTDHDLQVLWLYPTTDDPVEQAKIILGPFERILKKGDYKH